MRPHRKLEDHLQRHSRLRKRKKIARSPGNYDAELYAIYLLTSQQRQGAGRLLTQTLAASLRAGGFASILVWVLRQNPAVSFYEHLRGIQVAEKPIEVGGVHLSALAFAWPHLDQLARLSQLPPTRSQRIPDDLCQPQFPRAAATNLLLGQRLGKTFQVLRTHVNQTPSRAIDISDKKKRDGYK
ncbi:MAG: GNAT family N-acetyltransferase, partial [Silvibacterium sp.]